MLHRPPTRALSAAAAAGVLALGTLAASPASAAPPSNDDFANASLIGYDMAFTDNTEATLQIGEPTPSCAYDDGVNPPPFSEGTVWYVFNAPTTATAYVSTVGSSSPDTQLAVYQGGSLDSLAEVACSEDIDAMSGNFQSEVALPVDAGQTYFIQIATWTDNDQFHNRGPIQLTVSETPVGPSGPPNDTLSSPEVLSPGQATGSTVGATSDDVDAFVNGETGCPNQKTIWYLFQPGEAGTATVDLAGSDFDTTLAYVEADDEGLVSAVDCNEDDGASQTSRLSFPVTPGLNYYLQVGSAAGEEGNVLLDLTGPGAMTFDGDPALSGKAGKGKGATVAYTVRVRTDDSGGAPDNILVVTPPKGVAVKSVSSPDMECGPGAVPGMEDGIGCWVPAQPANTTSTMTVLVTPRSEGPFTLKARLRDPMMPRASIGRMFVRAAQSRTDDLSNNKVSIKAGTTVVCDNKATAKADKGTGSKQDDILCGLGGGDTLKGLAGDDLIFGGDGGDKIDGGGGADKLYGAGGDDDIVGGGGKDAIDGGAGKDKCKEPADTQTSCER